jgi:hypothetical protein
MSHGIFFFPTRDASALDEQTEDGALDLEKLLEAHRSRIQKLAGHRLYLPLEPLHVAEHNIWNFTIIISSRERICGPTPGTWMTGILNEQPVGEATGNT